MIIDVAKRLTNMPLFISDELPHYATVLSEYYSTTVEVKRSGRSGRPKNPIRVIDPNLKYAVVHKTRTGSKISSVEKKIIFGDKKIIMKMLKNSPSPTINTSYIERSNGTIRLWNSHLTRKSYRFAKSLAWLKSKLAITLVYYNFIMPHSTLSHQVDPKTGKKIYLPTTPAMSAGITNKPLTFPELLMYKAI
jgi:hypothetical protein